MAHDTNTRGRKANKEQRAVDAPLRFTTAPAHLPPAVKTLFDDCVLRMPPGFFTPGHVESLSALAGNIKIVRDLEAQVYAPGFRYTVIGSTGSEVINPLLRELSKQRQSLRGWLATCKLNPDSSYPSNRAVPSVTEEDVEAEQDDADPRLKRLRSVV